MSIMWEGRSLSASQDGISWVGPIEEGTPIHLSCKVTGGRPTPAITWWKGATIMEATKTVVRSNPHFRNPKPSRRLHFKRSASIDGKNSFQKQLYKSADRQKRHSISKEQETVDSDSSILSTLQRRKREGRPESNNRWWDEIQIPENEFNYTNFLQGNVKYTDQYEAQFGNYDPDQFDSSQPVDTKGPTAEPVQTKPAPLPPQAVILNSIDYDKELMVQSYVTVIANRDMVGVTIYCRADQALEKAPENLLKPISSAVRLNITCEYHT